MSPCLLCGSARAKLIFRASDRLYRTTSAEFGVVLCEDCGLLRLDPAPPAGELHKYYPRNYWFAPDEDAASRLEEAYRRLVLRDHVRFVERAIRRAPAGPLLDVGCGGGLFLGIMRERGFAVTGLDISSDAARIAWQRQRVPAVCGLLEQAPLREERFAAATLFHVLEHLPDPGEYLTAAYRLLKPGGRLVIQVPNAGCWQFRVLGRRWNGIDVPRHLFDFRSRDIEKLISSRGFEIVARKYFSLRDNPAGLASSIAPVLDPMARRVRRIPESPGSRLAKDLLYFGLVVASLPFTVLEAAFQAGSTVMIEARKP
jgi:SAM-dependent methyltransferase